MRRKASLFLLIVLLLQGSSEPALGAEARSSDLFSEALYLLACMPLRGSTEGFLRFVKGCGFDGLVLRASELQTARSALRSGLKAVVLSEDFTPCKKCKLLWRERVIRGGKRVEIALGSDSAGSLILVLAGRKTGKDSVDPASLVDLTGKVDSKQNLIWEVPRGTWSVMTFRLSQGLRPEGISFPAVGPVFSNRPEGLPWAEDFPNRYEDRFGEPLNRKDLAALVNDIGSRTELVRIRLNLVAREMLKDSLSAPPAVEPFDPALPFLLPGVRVISLRGWTGKATARYYGYPLRAAAGMQAPSGLKKVVCMLPEEGTWAVTPLRLLFHIQLAFMWGARSFVVPLLPPDVLTFSAQGTAPELPAQSSFTGIFVRRLKSALKTLSGFKPHAPIAIAQSEDEILATGKLGLGPACAGLLQEELYPFVVTSLGNLTRYGNLRAGELLYGPYRFRLIIVPVQGVLSVSSARRLLEWIEGGLTVIAAGSIPTVSPEEGRSSKQLAALFSKLREHSAFHVANNAQDVIDTVRKAFPPEVKLLRGGKGDLLLEAFEGKKLLLLNTSGGTWSGEIALSGWKGAAVAQALKPQGPYFLPPRRQEDGKLVVTLRLLPFEGILLTENPPTESPSGPVFEKLRSITLKGPWDLTPLAAEGVQARGGISPQIVFVLPPDLTAQPGDMLSISDRTYPLDLASGRPIDSPRWHGAWITTPEGKIKKPLQEDGTVFATTVRFHRTFHLNAPAISGRLWAMTRGNGLLQLNDRNVCFTMERGLLEVDITALLRAGKNTFKAEVSHPGHLLAEIRVCTLDGAQLLLATGRRWRTSVRKGRWRPAFILGHPDPQTPGPVEVIPQELTLLVPLPAGTKSISLPETWKEFFFLDSERKAAEAPFPLSRPGFLAVRAPRGPVAETPVLNFEPVRTSLRPLWCSGYLWFAGKVRYRTSFKIPEDTQTKGSQRVLIDLGRVCSFATLSLDGAEPVHVVFPPYRVVLPEPLPPGTHRLTVEIATPSTLRRRYLWPPGFVSPEVRRFCIEKLPDGMLGGLLGPVRIELLKELRSPASSSRKREELRSE